MQYHSNTGEGSLSVFLAELVQRHLESVLAANMPESLPENTTYYQPPEVPGGGGDDLQCRLFPEDGGSGGEGRPGFPIEEDGGEGRGPECDVQPESPSEKKQMSEEAQA